MHSRRKACKYDAPLEEWLELLTIREKSGMIFEEAEED